MEFHGNTVLIRMVEGLAFRYRWATEGLREEDLEFRPSEASMSFRELLNHELQLAWFIGNAFGIEVPDVSFDIEQGGVEDFRNAMLERLKSIKAKLQTLSDEDLSGMQIERKDNKYPLELLINGPISDALTHVGQINSWRRLNGNPCPGANLFMMEPPEI